MVADDGSGDRSEGEKELDLQTPADAEGNGNVETAASASEAPSPSEVPLEDTGASASEAPSPSEAPPEDAGESTTWTWPVMFLYFYGFVASVRPGESFITPNLLSPEKNFTREQVTNEITPVLTYSYMVALVPSFLLTDFLRYKPVLIIQSVGQVVIWIILLLGDTLLQMQFMEFFYGATMACRLAYSSYIFSLVNPASYQSVASNSRFSVLFGVFISSFMGQLLLSVGDITYYTLSAITLGVVTFSMLLSLFLPWPKHSLYFNRTKTQEQNKLAGDATQSELDRMNPREGGGSSSATPRCSVVPRWRDSVFVQMLLELRNLVKTPSLRLWSLWWVFNSTGYYLVLFYVHILWNKVYPATENKDVYNGGVEAVSTLLSASATLLSGRVKMRWNVWSELVIGVMTALQAGLLLLMGTTDNIWVCYVSYVLFRSSYQFLVPIATFQIASSLSKELCALAFGVNTFLSTVLKSIIIVIVADKKGLGLGVRLQFLVYFAYFALLTAAYLAGAAVVLVRHFRNKPREEGGASDQATSTELSPVTVESEAQPLSNGGRA